MKLPTNPSMSAEEFRAVLLRLSLSQSEFARVLRRLGDTRPERTVLRAVHAMANDEVRVSPAVVCLLTLMGRTDAWKEESAIDRTFPVGATR